MSDDKETKKNDHDDDYEKICSMCKRTESRAGKMVTMPGNIDICPDCLQKSFDMMSTMNLGGLDFLGSKPNTSSKKESEKPEETKKKLVDFGDDEEEDFGDDFDGFKDPAMRAMFTGEDDDDKDKPLSEQTTADKLRFLKDMPNVRFINLSGEDLDKRKRQRVKKKTNGSEKTPAIDIKKVPAPHKIKEQLDEYIIGQEQAKKIVSVAVYNHYKRVATNTMDDIEIEKSNMLMIGPTGCGKTYLVKTLARLLDVPLAIADATSLTEAGYIGDDIESVISKLLAAADNDVDKAETGIVFIDEIDKLAKKKNVTNRDVSGESVQQGLLKLLEGSDIEVPVGANSKSAMVPLATVNTKNILFICGGAFPDLEEVIKERVNKEASIGFGADLKDKYDNVNDLVRQVTLEDLRNFGMIPEFLGRLPVLFTLDGLTEDMLVQVLKEPRNAILKQYQKLLELDEVNLKFDDEAIKAIAKKAVDRKTGARALRAIIEEFMLDIMYEIPKDKNIGTVTITKDYIENTGGPIIQMRGVEELPKEEKMDELGVEPAYASIETAATSN